MLATLLLPPGFGFEMRSGLRSAVGSKEPVPVKLDKAFVRAFIEHVDSLIEHDNIQAAALCMAKDWTLRVGGPGGTAIGIAIADRTRFLAARHDARQHASNYSHRREIFDITISESGTSAWMESRETETSTIAGTTQTEQTRSTDTFELRGQTMLWTSTSGEIEQRTGTRSN